MPLLGLQALGHALRYGEAQLLTADGEKWTSSPCSPLSSTRTTFAPDPASSVRRWTAARICAKVCVRHCWLCS